MCSFRITCYASLVVSALACWWPPSFGPCPPTTTITTTTTTLGPRAAERQFEQGVMETLGYTTGVACFQDAKNTSREIYEIVEEFSKGGLFQKAKALGKLALEISHVIKTLETCSEATTDAEEYAKLMKDLVDPRYYTVYNACTLALNVVADHAQLASFLTDLRNGQDYLAGKAIMRTILNVMENPGMPSSNGTAAVQLASGLSRAIVNDVEVKCFLDAKVEVPLVVGGVMACVSGVGIIPGLESLFHGLEGIMPMIKDCSHDKHQILGLLHTFKHFTDPRALARKFGRNILSNRVDLTIELAQAVLDVEGQDYERLGEDVGRILGKLAISNTSFASRSVVVV